MKNILYILFAIILLSSCTSDIKYDGFTYTIIDTTYISKNGFGFTLGYDVIIEMDSNLYSANMNSCGEVTTLYRKLKIKK